MRELKECRICLSSENEKNIITPCDCKGSIKYVHKECLQKWVDVKRSLNCDICKRDYNNLSKFQKVVAGLEEFTQLLSVLCLLFISQTPYVLLFLVFGVFIILEQGIEKLKKLKLKLKTIKRRLKKMRRRIRRREQAIN